MRVDDLSLKDLEWHKLKQEWKALTSTYYGKTFIENLTFNLRPEELVERLDLSKEIFEAQRRGFYVPSVPDVSYMRDLPSGYILSTQQLWDIASFIESLSLSWKSKTLK